MYGSDECDCNLDVDVCVCITDAECFCTGLCECEDCTDMVGDVGGCACGGNCACGAYEPLEDFVSQEN